MSHTPGPWRLEPCSHGGLILRRGDDNGPLMSRHPQGGLQIVPEADARLIAAAPDLLEACRFVAKWLCDDRPIGERESRGFNPKFVKANNAVLAAIAKAEGKQS